MCTAFAGCGPVRLLDFNCIIMQCKSTTLRVRFDVLHFVNPSSDNVSGAIVAWKGRDEQASTRDVYSLPGGGEGSHPFRRGQLD